MAEIPAASLAPKGPQGPSELDSVIHEEATELGKPRLQKETPAKQGAPAGGMSTP